MDFEKADDVYLIKQIAAGQTAAVEALYDRYNRLVFSAVLVIVGDRAVAEEVTLDVFVHVWRGAKTYDDTRAGVRTWLAAIARHHAIDILRWQGSRVDSRSVPLDDFSLAGDPNLPDPEAQAELSIQRRRVQQALAQLPEEQRLALFLAYFKGFSHQQISEQLRQPLGTVKTRIRLAMQKLRRILVDEQQPSNTSERSGVTYPTNRKD
jgi:RNA polymerase sigma factor, sigma-70 family